MNKKKKPDADIVDRTYAYFKSKTGLLSASIIPYIRRFQRFVALPYAYFFLVNWKECTASPLRVLSDFIYIFFVLKDYPDYYTQFRFWDVDREEWKFYYGSFYNPYQKGRLRRNVQKKEYEIIFADKYVSHQLCKGVNLPEPEFLGYLEPGMNYRDSLHEMISIHKKIIIKSSRGKGGKDIFLGLEKDNKITISDKDTEYPVDDFELPCPVIVQKFVTQHPELEAISRSVNTIRTETILTHENDVLILGGFMRFGLNNTYVDNQSSGGLSVGIDLEKGVLKKYALDGRGVQYTSHPDSGIVFENFKIPFWDEIVKLSENIQKSFPYYKIIGPDIAITESGPVIIEINATPDHAGLEMDYGPTFKNEQVLLEFYRYGLLINKPIISVAKKLEKKILTNMLQQFCDAKIQQILYGE